MDLQSRIRRDAVNIFSNFPEMEMRKADETDETVTCKFNALQSFVTLISQTETGRDIHVDSAQVSINANNVDVQAFNPVEDDRVTISDLVGNDRDFYIKTIDRDRTVGVWLCDLEVVKTKDKAGVIDRSDELVTLESALNVE